MLLSPIPHFSSPGSLSNLDGKPYIVYRRVPDLLPLLCIFISILLLSIVSTHLYSKNYKLGLLAWNDCGYALCCSVMTSFC